MTPEIARDALREAIFFQVSRKEFRQFIREHPELRLEINREWIPPARLWIDDLPSPPKITAAEWRGDWFIAPSHIGEIERNHPMNPWGIIVIILCMCAAGALCWLGIWKLVELAS